MKHWPVSATIALLLGFCAFILTVWIVLPAPHHLVWQLAVGASEWGLWFAAMGLAGMALGIASQRLRRSTAAVCAMVLGACAAGLGAYPLVSALQVASTNEVPLSLARYLWGVLDKPKGAPPQTVIYHQVAGQALQLDVFLPAPGKQGARPAVIVVHGGGWDSGDKSDFPDWNHWLNQNGYVVFDIQYRLYPQPNWQTATADVKCAVAWVSKNAALYGVDPDRLALLGRSAGGHLALLAAYTEGVAELPSGCPGPAGGGTAVRAAVGFYAPVDMLWDYDNPANQQVLGGPATLRRLLGGTPQSAAGPYTSASPIRHVQARTPPTLLVQSGTDQLVRVENMQRLAQVLSDARVRHRSLLIPYAQHGFDYNFNGWGSQIVQPVLLQFLGEHLQPR